MELLPAFGCLSLAAFILSHPGVTAHCWTTFLHAYMPAHCTHRYDIGIIGGVIVMNDFRDSMSLPREGGTGGAGDEDQHTISTLGWIVGTFSIGCATGSLFAGSCADRYGRKVTIIAGSILFTIGGICQACADAIGWLIIGRLVSGLGVGFLSLVVPLYCAEMAPARLRGMLVSFQQLMIDLGIILAFLVNFLLQAQHNGWRLALGLQVLTNCLTCHTFLSAAPFTEPKTSSID